jgi:hypothetical protein
MWQLLQQQMYGSAGVRQFKVAGHALLCWHRWVDIPLGCLVTLKLCCSTVLAKGSCGAACGLHLLRVLGLLAF